MKDLYEQKVEIYKGGGNKASAIASKPYFWTDELQNFAQHYGLEILTREGFAKLEKFKPHSREGETARSTTVFLKEDPRNPFVTTSEEISGGPNDSSEKINRIVAFLEEIKNEISPDDPSIQAELSDGNSLPQEQIDNMTPELMSIYFYRKRLLMKQSPRIYSIYKIDTSTTTYMTGDYTSSGHGESDTLHMWLHNKNLTMLLEVIDFLLCYLEFNLFFPRRKGGSNPNLTGFDEDNRPLPYWRDLMNYKHETLQSANKIYEKRRELYKKYYEFRRKNIKGDQDSFPMYTSFPEIKKIVKTSLIETLNAFNASNWYPPENCTPYPQTLYTEETKKLIIDISKDQDNVIYKSLINEYGVDSEAAPGLPSDYLLCLNRNGKIKAIGGKSQIEEKVERYDLTWGDSVIPPIFNGLLFSFVMSNDGSIYLFSKRKRDQGLRHHNLTKLLENFKIYGPEKPLLAAGDLYFDMRDGSETPNYYISVINNKSGFFLPGSFSNLNMLEIIKSHITSTNYKLYLQDATDDEVELNVLNRSSEAKVDSDSDSDSDSDTDSEDGETIPAGSKLADVSPGADIELDTRTDPNAEKIKILKKLNFAEIPVPDDGDCLFESMALFLKHKFADRSDITNKQLRQEIVDEIHDNWDQYKEFIVLREDCSDEENKESPEQLNNWCKTPENYKQMMMVTRDSNGNFPSWYVPRARFGGFEEVKVFSKLYNIGANLWVINEADKKLSNPVSLPIEGRPTANFLFDPIKGHYSLLDNLQDSMFTHPLSPHVDTGKVDDPAPIKPIHSLNITSRNKLVHGKNMPGPSKYIKELIDSTYESDLNLNLNEFDPSTGLGGY